jgi:hypothetical protein
MKLNTSMLCHYVECNVSFIIMLKVIMLSVVTLNVVMLIVVAPASVLPPVLFQPIYIGKLLAFKTEA